MDGGGSDSSTLDTSLPLWVPPHRRMTTMTRDAEREIILLVDDNAEIREFVKRLLEEAQYTVATAADGEVGLRFFKEHQSNIMLLLTDVLMPKMSGFELADRVLEMDSQMRILFLSGDVWCGYRGFECIAKPFQPAELVEKVSRALNANTYSEKPASAA
jgi:two-component system, cell cycle sensor histidine kinase and response regulator CckA